jgi:hypothetical protein
MALTTEGGDIFELADRLTAAGWHVQPTYAYGNSPAHIHLTVDPGNAGRVGELLSDLRAQAKDLPPSEDAPAPVVQLLEALAQGGSNGGIDVGNMMAEFGIRDGKMPEQQATIHRMLNSVSPTAREKLLVLFLGEMFS